MKKLTITTTLTALVTLTLTACGSEERPQNPTYNPADSTYTALPTEVNQDDSQDAFQSKAINFCQLETARQTGDPENTRTSYTNFDLSDTANNQGERIYTLTGETAVIENGAITDYVNTCITEVTTVNSVDVITIYLTPKN